LQSKLRLFLPLSVGLLTQAKQTTYVRESASNDLSRTRGNYQLDDNAIRRAAVDQNSLSFDSFAFVPNLTLSDFKRAYSRLVDGIEFASRASHVLYYESICDEFG